MTKNILVIDDDRLVTHTLGNLLSKEGYSATTSDEGFKALDEIFSENKFDLIICDLRLPGIDGFETVKRIKKYLEGENKPDIPVIFITGYTDLYEKARKLGKVFLKPFDNDEFIKSVKEYLHEEDPNYR